MCVCVCCTLWHTLWVNLPPSMSGLSLLVRMLVWPCFNIPWFCSVSNYLCSSPHCWPITIWVPVPVDIVYWLLFIVCVIIPINVCVSTIPQMCVCVCCAIALYCVCVSLSYLSVSIVYFYYLRYSARACAHVGAWVVVLGGGCRYFVLHRYCIYIYTHILIQWCVYTGELFCMYVTLPRCTSDSVCCGVRKLAASVLIQRLSTCPHTLHLLHCSLPMISYDPIILFCTFSVVSCPTLHFCAPVVGWTLLDSVTLPAFRFARCDACYRTPDYSRASDCLLLYLYFTTIHRLDDWRRHCRTRPFITVWWYRTRTRTLYRCPWWLPAPMTFI